MTLPMLIVSVLKVLTYIINSITGHPIRLAEILAIMSVSTFITDILYVLYVSYIVLVFTQDMINRRIAMDMMMHVAQSQKHKQFIFLTPQNMR